MSEQSVNFRSAGDLTVATPQGPEVVPGLGEILQERLRELAASGKPVKFILDLSNITFLGSIGLGVLVVFLKHIKAADAQLALAGLTKHCRNVLEVMGLNKVFQIYDDLSAALDAMQEAA